MNWLRNLAFATVASSTLMSMGAASAKAEPAAGITASCPYTGPGIAVCAAAGVVLHELVQLGNGKRGFGPNGEIMKVLSVPVKIIDGNVKGATREKGELAKVLRGITGVSIRDIERYGIFGGPNSIFHKPFG